MKNLIAVMMLGFLFAGQFSGQVFANDYQRKSISQVQVLVSNNGVSSKNASLSASLLDAQLTSKLNLPRFDINPIPDAALTSFNQAVSEWSELDSQQIQRAISQYLQPELSRILNDPLVQQRRMGRQNAQENKMDLASTKGQSSGMVLSDYEWLMNAAFVAVPYIKERSFSVLTEDVECVVDGGILWYQFQDDGQGNQMMVLVADTQSTMKGYSSFKLPKDKKKRRQYNIPSSVYRKAQDKALRIWITDLSVKVRQLPQFRLSGTVLSVQGRVYDMNLGVKDGVKMDDSFLLYEMVETSKGIYPKRKGYLQVLQVGQVEGETQSVSRLVQRLGQTRGAGGWLEEYARTGLDFQPVFLKKEGLSVPYQSLILTERNGGLLPILNSDVSRGYGVMGRLSYNLAPWVNVSQLFVYLRGQSLVLDASVSEGVSGIPYLRSAYGGLIKKWWWRGQNVYLGVGLGSDELRFKGSLGAKSIELKARSLGASILLGAERLLGPNLSLSAYAAWQANLAVTGGHYHIGDDRWDWSDIKETSTFSDLKLGGASIGFGLNYSISSFSGVVNAFSIVF
ncbi:MAG: hypothetical protein CL521_00450 [Actinobacteria bacterium]|nr:hypothetical protein [Actinomycetota bacterium]